MEMRKMNMTQLGSLAKERNLRGYSRLRKADLINFINEFPREEPIINEQPQKDEILSKASSKASRKHQAKL